MRSLSERVASVPWFHSIDLGGGIITPGVKSHPLLLSELKSLRLPDLNGLSVLDVGAWDGFFSFAAERLGAARVVSLDHYVWRHESFGKEGYDLAHEVLGSKAEDINDDFMTTDFKRLGGVFDVVLFLGVLYHCRHPLLALERIAEATKTLTIIETETIRLRGSGRRAYCEFFPESELRDDSSNWWSPNIEALVALCKAAGFARVELIAEPLGSPLGLLRRAVDARMSLRGYVAGASNRLKGFVSGKARGRVVVHAYKEG